ncbi:2'-5' RNA ligase [Slackia heliotrinireducens]|uniref:RNA 2',3'-cyclic phosphodiesterase n=2 Tax=Slackia TaxID=84108 RepID=C7N7Q5_SLAHD|nr:2'-5' RNA ligase [Slackia heliotrinireducens DSM 20476]VEH01774.1 2'-5' RNA ligase [Slackia heliotrinireducens]
MRTFIAIDPPEAFIDETADLARYLKTRIDGRFIAREAYHVTLAFLGDADQRQIASAMDAIDAVADRVSPTLSPGGLGVFGKPKDCTLYLELQKDPSLLTLCKGLREELESRDVPFDSKPFLPHVTLARRAHVPDGNLAGIPFPNACRADRVVLFKSVLTPEGASYSPLYERELG